MKWIVIYNVCVVSGDKISVLCIADAGVYQTCLLEVVIKLIYLLLHNIYNIYVL